MAVTLIRTTIIFITLFITMRLMGKRQIGEMQPYEFIVTLIIADLACIPMADVSIPLTYGIISILGLFILHQVLSLLEQGGDIFRRVISGKPSVVINRDGIDMKELKKNNMGLDDLIESMRSGGYFSLDDVSYAIFESNGKLSTLQDGTKKTTSKSLPLLIVNDGKTVNKNLKLLSLTESDIIEFINKQKETLKRTEALTIDGDGRVYFKSKNKKYSILNFNLPEGIEW